MIDPLLDGKVALVTGANQGIGAATAQRLAAQSTAVFVTYYGHPPAEAVLQTIRATGGRAAAAHVDLADPAAAPALFDIVEAAIGPVDILVNNAAHWGPPDTLLPIEPGTVPFHANTFQETLSAANFDRHVAVNSRAVALMMAEYVRRYLARGGRWGRIVNLSTDGARCFSGEVSYGASKAALESLTRSAAVEFGPLGITVNAVSPGPTQTGDPPWITPDMEERMARATPLRRVGRPEDVADVILFLASEQGRWLTGQVLHAGGGHTI